MPPVFKVSGQRTFDYVASGPNNFNYTVELIRANKLQEGFIYKLRTELKTTGFIKEWFWYPEICNS